MHQTQDSTIVLLIRADKVFVYLRIRMLRGLSKGGSLLNDLLLAEHSMLLRGKTGDMHQFRTDFLPSNIHFFNTQSGTN